MQHNAVYPQKINFVDSTILIFSTKFIYQNLLQFFFQFITDKNAENVYIDLQRIDNEIEKKTKAK